MKENIKALIISVLLLILIAFVIGTILVKAFGLLFKVGFILIGVLFLLLLLYLFHKFVKKFSKRKFKE